MTWTIFQGHMYVRIINCKLFFDSCPLYGCCTHRKDQARYALCEWCVFKSRDLSNFFFFCPCHFAFKCVVLVFALLVNHPFEPTAALSMVIQAYPSLSFFLSLLIIVKLRTWICKLLFSAIHILPMTFNSLVILLLGSTVDVTDFCEFLCSLARTHCKSRLFPKIWIPE